MKIVDTAGVEAWLANAGLSNSNRTVELPGGTDPIYYRTPPDSGKKTALARQIVAASDKGESLLWITEYGIWPSSEHRNLFDGYRQSLGERRTVDQAPGHIFSTADKESATSLLALVFYFIWGAVFVSKQSGISISISHDEYFSLQITGVDPERAARLGIIDRIAIREDEA